MDTIVRKPLPEITPEFMRAVNLGLVHGYKTESINGTNLAVGSTVGLIAEVL